MRYIFESGQYPNNVELDDRELSDDRQATIHALDIGADYVWDVPEDGNPMTVWRRDHHSQPNPRRSTRTRWPTLLLYAVLISLAAYASDRIATFERGILASFVR